MMSAAGTVTVAVWRHPRPENVSGRCIGHTDAPVDRRKSKRLAHRIRRWARLHGAAPVVTTSSLQRAAGVGRCLAEWGWCHHIDPRLNEMDFGAWDGLAWTQIGAEAVQAWCDDFSAHRPGGGESVADLLARCAAFLAEPPRERPPQGPRLVVAHAGWISAARWLQRGQACGPNADEWPAAVAYASLVTLSQPLLTPPLTP